MPRKTKEKLPETVISLPPPPPVAVKSQRRVKKAPSLWNIVAKEEYERKKAKDPNVSFSDILKSQETKDVYAKRKTAKGGGLIRDGMKLAKKSGLVDFLY